MTIELRPLDLAMFRTICDAFAATDASHADRVAQLCSEAAAAVHNPEIRAYESPGYETIGGQSWRDTLHSMFEGFVRDGLQARICTIEEWGDQLSSHLMAILAMPGFQTRYRLMEGESKRGILDIQWEDPVRLVVLGEMDGGLLTLLESNGAGGGLLRLTNVNRGPIGLAGGWSRPLSGSDLAILSARVCRIASAESGLAQEVCAKLSALIDFAVAGPGAVLISQKPKRW